VEARSVDAQILVVAEQEHVAATIRAAGGGAIVVKTAVQNLDVADGVGQARRLVVARADVGETVLDGIADVDVVEDDSAGVSRRVVAREDPILLAGGIDGEVLQLEHATEGAGTGNLTGNDGRAACSHNGQRQAICNVQVLGEGTGSDQDGCACVGGVDGRLDREPGLDDQIARRVFNHGAGVLGDRTRAVILNAHCESQRIGLGGKEESEVLAVAQPAAECVVGDLPRRRTSTREVGREGHAAKIRRRRLVVSIDADGLAVRVQAAEDDIAGLLVVVDVC